MPTLHPLTDRLSVTAQIEVDDIAELATQGVRSIINNRPDGEADDQPSSAELQAAAQQAGLAYQYIPVTHGPLLANQVDAFAAALRDLPAPVLAFCRSGNRCSILWALQAEGTADAIIDAALGAGYDLSWLRPQLSRDDHS